MNQLNKSSVQNKNKEAIAARKPNYYLGLFTVESWREFKRHGGQVMGFNENKAKTVAKLLPGDVVLCYLTKVSDMVRWDFSSEDFCRNRTGFGSYFIDTHLPFGGQAFVPTQKPQGHRLDYSCANLPKVMG
jgi:hypothetical protein